MASFFASSKIIVFTTFTVHVLLGKPITASSVFVTVSLYGTIKLTVTLFFPLAIEKLSETVVSIRRIKVRPSPAVDRRTCVCSALGARAFAYRMTRTDREVKDVRSFFLMLKIRIIH